MKLLLDTHVWVWSLTGSDRVPRRVAGRLRSPQAELWLSPLSILEVNRLVDRGRLRFTAQPDVWVADALAARPMREALLSFDVVGASRGVQLSHADPIDRLLAATARALDLKLVTADERLQGGRGYSTLPWR